MRRSLVTAALVAGACVLPAQASAAVPHVVQPGETLWSIAAANNLYTGALAAYNGLPPESNVVAGTTVMVPSGAEALPKVNEAIANGAPQPSGVVIPSSAPASTGGTSAAAPSSGSGTGGTSASSSAPPPPGAYEVQPGDTFSSLAAKAGVRPEQIAGVNGLDVNGFLIEGTTIKLPPASAPVQQEQASGNAPTAANPPATSEGPAATPGRVTSSDIHRVAAQNGVDGSLAAAIGWQESGFNNAMVSSANARGVMQVMPGTWDWVQRNLASRKLDPASAEDNVHAGTLYLAQLLKETGGDPVTAAAGYYQGLASVKKIGMLPETQQYVNNVMALRNRFGG
jgi:soluble lytic murein transglycosylase-like protein